jgi:hypothetical protein
MTQELELKIYNFLLSSMRKEDEKTNYLLKRFLEGPQEVWKIINGKIFDVKKLWDVINVDNKYLEYLAPIVGWTGTYESIIDKLVKNKDYTTLRRLILTSIPLWKKRSTEDSLMGVLGEEIREGADSWLFDNPETVSGDEYYSNLRIVDDGNLDKTLVVSLVKLMRPINEKIEIVYLGFMELFTIDNDDSQWTEIAGSLDIAGGTAELDNTSISESAIVEIDEQNTAENWDNYLSYFKIKGTATTGTFGCGVYTKDSPSVVGYWVGLKLSTNQIILYSNSGGTLTPLSTFEYSSMGILTANVYYGIRIQATDEGANTRIKVYIDSEEVISVTNANYSEGSLVIWHDQNATLEVDEIEMTKLPASTYLVDINT